MTTPAISELIVDPADACSALSAALVANKPWALRELLVDYRAYVARTLCRVLGPRSDLEDLVHDVFVRALELTHRLNDREGIRPWIGAITVFIARETLQRQRRRRWVFFMPDEDVPDCASRDASPEVVRALNAAYALLRKLNTDEQIVFALRYLDGRTLSEIAELVDCSLSTVKRRLERADAAFFSRAKTDPWLAGWMEGNR